MLVEMSRAVDQSSMGAASAMIDCLRSRPFSDGGQDAAIDEATLPQCSELSSQAPVRFQTKKIIRQIGYVRKQQK
jgi:hypothetical protein